MALAGNNTFLKKRGWLLPILIVLLLIVLRAVFLSPPDRTEQPLTVASHQSADDTAAETLSHVAAHYQRTQSDLAALQDAVSDLSQSQQTQASTLTALTDSLKALASQQESTDVIINPPSHAKAIGVMRDPAWQEKNNETARDIAAPYAHYTVPANGTAIDAVLMTALVGRIPKDGQVDDPYPFKLIMGQENLAANGQFMPDLAGMVVSGYAMGDLVLSAVRGWITSVTFVFPDGRIAEINTQLDDTRQASHDSLGYLSDPYGNPFLQGQLITNAPQQLAGTTLLGGLAGVGEIVSAQQMQTSQYASGATTTWLAGDAGKQLAGHAGQRAANDALAWWQARMGNSFDAIYVQSGQPVAVHFTKTIQLDYQMDGRQLGHETTSAIFTALD